MDVEKEKTKEKEKLLETLRQIVANVESDRYQGEISVDRCGTSDGRMTITLRLVADWAPRSPDAVRPAIHQCRAHDKRCNCGKCGGHGWTVVDQFPGGAIDLLSLMGG